VNHNNGIQVVVAEDDYLVSEMVQGLLQEMGYLVLGVASNGRQIIKMAKQLKPDVIIMDIQMADIDGITAAQEIQRAYPIPVVVLTAYETPDLVRQASEAGVGAYLIKPPNSRELERAITIALARHNDILELRRLNDALTGYNEELDAFAHTVAHDLQNPLGQIVGFAELILDNLTDYSREEIGSYVRLIPQRAKDEPDY
jgi:DNA-binding NarL/FixJ family response regulator